MNKITPIKTRKPLDSAALLEPFFAPRGVVVIGASPKPENQGRRIVESLLASGYTGEIATVHPKGLYLRSVPVVTDIRDLPERIDLAIAAVSAKNVLPLIEPLAEKGIRRLIVFSGGFAEMGEEGKLLQDELKALGEKFGVRILGPNCIGAFSPADRFNSFFLSPSEIFLPGTGSLALISQSGVFMWVILNQLAARGVGVRRAVSFGNRVDIGEVEVLEAFGADPAIKVVGIYLENVRNGPEFLTAARQVIKTKPIIIYKGGKGEKGGRATLAHSASLAGSYTVFKTACEQTGMIEVQGINEMINSLQALSSGIVPKGNRVLIVSNGGGMGVLLTDLCEQGGCEVHEPPQEAQRELKKFLPGYYSFKNPVDLTGSGTNEQCVRAVDKILHTGLYDALLLVALPGTEGITTELAKGLQEILPPEFPVVIGAYGDALFSRFSVTFQNKGILVFPAGEDAAWAMNLLVRAGQKRRATTSVHHETKTPYNPAPTFGWLGGLGRVPDEMEIKNLIAQCGVQIPKGLLIAQERDIKKAITEIGFPLVLKAVGKDIAHKTELGGIRLDISHENELREHWKRMNLIWPGRIWAERQMDPGLDLMIAMSRDPGFGPVFVFGTGGKYVELYQDIKSFLLPASEEEILRAIFKTHAGQIIQGVRGDPALDLGKLLGFIQLLTQWVEGEPKIQSLDFNPVRLYKNALVALDAKLQTLI